MIRACSRLTLVLWFSCCAALAGSVQASIRGEERVSALVEALGSSDFKVRNEAYQTLMREKPATALASLADVLPRIEPAGQILGLYLLNGAYPRESSEPVLRRFLKGKSPLLELGAAAHFVSQGESAEVEHIVRPLSRPGLPPEVASQMLGLLRGLKDARITEAVRALLVVGTPPAVLGDALYHLLVIGDSGSRPRVSALRSDAALDPASRRVCTAWLLALGDESMSSAVALDLSAGGVGALSTLSRFLEEAPQLGDEALAAIADLAESSASSGSAQIAIRLLARQAGPKQVRALETLVGHKDPLVAKAALDALQKRGVTIPRATLLTLLTSSEPGRALAAADALRRADDDAGFARLMELARADGKERAEAVRVLAQFRRHEAFLVLFDALESSEVLVRSAAELGVGALLTNLYPYRRFDLATTGYSARATPEVRAAGLAKIRAWWEVNGRK